MKDSDDFAFLSWEGDNTGLSTNNELPDVPLKFNGKLRERSKGTKCRHCCCLVLSK